MKKRFVVVVCVGLALTMTACSTINPAANARSTPIAALMTSTPQPSVTPPPPSPTPSPLPPKALDTLLTNNCLLLNSHDIASLYATHTEVQNPVLQTGVVTHAIFSTEKVTATQSSCINYAFHLPGSIDGEMLQVTYWVDVPAATPASAWAKLWTDASAQAAQTISGIGDGAFFSHGRLTFKDGDLYITLEAIGTKLNTDTSVGVTQQITIEKQLALDAFNRARAF
jgi:hypothetical protein